MDELELYLDIEKLKNEYDTNSKEAVDLFINELEVLHNVGDEFAFREYVDEFSTNQDKTRAICDDIWLDVLTEEVFSNTKSKGVYSLYNGWLRVPEKEEGKTLDDNNEKFIELQAKISKALIEENLKEIDKLIEEVYKLRQKSLLKNDEFDEGNLIFKKIRDKGLLDKLRKKKVELEEKELSLY